MEESLVSFELREKYLLTVGHGKPGGSPSGVGSASSGDTSPFSAASTSRSFKISTKRKMANGTNQKR